MDPCALGLPCALLLLFSTLACSASGAQKCAPRALPDMVIDIGQAVALGARFTDPLQVASVEECVSACCRQLEAGGDRACNLLAFDARRPGAQNCYLFHCPSLDSCPLFSSPGVFTYSFGTDPSRPGKPDPEKEKPKSEAHDKAPASEKTSGSGHKGSGKKPQVPAEPEAKEDLSDTSKSITSQLLHLADEMDQHLEKMASEDHLREPSPSSATVPAVQTPAMSVHRPMKKLPAKAPKPGKAKPKKPEDVPTHRPTAATKEVRTSPRPSTAAPHLVPRTNASHIVPPAATTEETGTKNVPSSNASSTKMAGSGHTEVPALTTAHHTRPPHTGTRPSPSWTSPWKANDQPSGGRVLPETHPPAQEAPAVNLEEAPRTLGSSGPEGAVPPPEDKSGLVAALVFGMSFLMVVIGLVSRKVSEARRRHRYTKLDYLINGMYVDT